MFRYKFSKRFTSSLSVDKTALLTQISSFWDHSWGFWHFLPSLKCNGFFVWFLLWFSYALASSNIFETLAVIIKNLVPTIPNIHQENKKALLKHEKEFNIEFYEFHQSKTKVSLDTLSKWNINKDFSSQRHSSFILHALLYFHFNFYFNILMYWYIQY